MGFFHGFQRVRFGVLNPSSLNFLNLSTLLSDAFGLWVKGCGFRLGR